MKRTRPLTIVWLVAGVVVGGLGTGRADAQPDEFSATMQVETGGQPMTMEYFVAAGRVRVDVQQPQQVSIVFRDGDAGMLMIQHAERRYMEWGPDQMKMMQQMMERLQQGDVDEPGEVDISQISFEQTGRTDTIGDWDAFEVRATGIENVDNEEMLFWMSADTDIGMFEVSEAAAEALKAFQMPMAGGGTAGAQQFLRYRSIARASGLPDGGVVRVHAQNDGEQTTITLLAVQTASLPDGTFEAPDGYEAMRMPSISGLPE